MALSNFFSSLIDIVVYQNTNIVSIDQHPDKLEFPSMTSYLESRIDEDIEKYLTQEEKMEKGIFRSRKIYWRQ